MNLLGMSRSLRSPFGGSVKPQPGGAAMAPLRAQLINSSPWAKYAIAAVEATNLDGRAREVAMSALKSGMDDKAKSLVVKAEGAAWWCCHGPIESTTYQLKSMGEVCNRCS